MTEFIELAYDYLDLLKENPNYIKLVSLNREVNLKYELEFNEFKTISKRFDEVMEIGTYHPDFRDVSKEFSRVKANLYEKPLIKEYLLLDKKIEQMINELLSEIAMAISPNILVKDQFGFIKGGGSCEGC